MKKLLLVLLICWLPFVSADKCGYPVYLSEDCNFQAFHSLADSSDVVKWSLIDPDESLIWASIDDNGFNSDGNYFYLNTGSILNKIGEWTVIVDFVDLTAAQGNTDKKNFVVVKKEEQRYCAKDDLTCLENQKDSDESIKKTEYKHEEPDEKTLILGFIPVENPNIIIGVIIIIVLLLVVLWKA